MFHLRQKRKTKKHSKTKWI